jgi:hypothetical protein
MSRPSSATVYGRAVHQAIGLRRSSLIPNARSRAKGFALSQHNINLVSPLVGSVQISAGFDPRLNEVFVNFMNEHVQFMSPPTTTLEDVPAIVREHLHVDLPQQVLDGVAQDHEDFVKGAKDVGRRIRQYQADGSLLHAVTY